MTRLEPRRCVVLAGILLVSCLLCIDIYPLMVQTWSVSVRLLTLYFSRALLLSTPFNPPGSFLFLCFTATRTITRWSMISFALQRGIPELSGPGPSHQLLPTLQITSHLWWFYGSSSSRNPSLSARFPSRALSLATHSKLRPHVCQDNIRQAPLPLTTTIPP